MQEHEPVSKIVKEIVTVAQSFRVIDASVSHN
jgi:hypothetical protein